MGGTAHVRTYARTRTHTTRTCCATHAAHLLRRAVARPDGEDLARALHEVVDVLERRRRLRRAAAAHRAAFGGGDTEVGGRRAHAGCAAGDVVDESVAPRVGRRHRLSGREGFAAWSSRSESGGEAVCNVGR